MPLVSGYAFSPLSPELMRGPAHLGLALVRIANSESKLRRRGAGGAHGVLAGDAAGGCLRRGQWRGCELVADLLDVLRRHRGSVVAGQRRADVADDRSNLLVVIDPAEDRHPAATGQAKTY